MREKKSFPEKLNEVIRAYKANPGEDTFSRLLCCVFRGIECDAEAAVPADLEKKGLRPRFLERADGRMNMVILTVPDGKKYPYFAGVRLRDAVDIALTTNKCAGIVVDPGEDTEVVIMKELLFGALGAAISLLKDEHREEKVQELTLRRPIDEETFDRIEDIICEFRDDPGDFLVLDLTDDDDDMLFIQAARAGEELHVELAFDMSDFQWEHPLILGNDMPLGEALELLRQLCVEGESPDDIDAVQNGFRCLDIWKERAPEGADAPQEDPAGEDTDA